MSEPKRTSLITATGSHHFLLKECLITSKIIIATKAIGSPTAGPKMSDKIAQKIRSSITPAIIVNTISIIFY